MKHKTIFLAVVFVVIGFLILLERYMNYGIWFQINDIHHETFAETSYALSLGIIVGSQLK